VAHWRYALAVQRDQRLKLDQSHHRLPSSPLARLTLTRSCAPYVRIICTSESTRFTRTLAVFPPAVMNGRPITAYSPVSSVRRRLRQHLLGHATVSLDEARRAA
jgi:hypothetical protein